MRSKALASLVWIHRKLGKPLPAEVEEALAEELLRLRRAIYRDPDSTASRNSLAWLLAGAGRDLDEALREAQQIALDP